MRLTELNRLRVRPQLGSLQVIGGNFLCASYAAKHIMNKLTRRLTICLSALAFVATYFGLGPALYWIANLDEPTATDVSAFVQSRLNDPNHTGDHILSLDPDKVLTVTSASNLSLSRISYSSIGFEDVVAAYTGRVLFAEISADLSLKNDDGVTTTQTVSDHVIQIDSTCFEDGPFVFRTKLTGIVFSPDTDVVALARWKDVPKVIFNPELLLISAIVGAFVYGAGVFVHKCLVAIVARVKVNAA